MTIKISRENLSSKPICTMLPNKLSEDLAVAVLRYGKLGLSVMNLQARVARVSTIPKRMLDILQSQAQFSTTHSSPVAAMVFLLFIWKKKSKNSSGS